VPTQPPIQWVSRTLSVGVKRLEREDDYSPTSSVDVKECVRVIPQSQYVFIERCLVKHRDKFTFTLRFTLYVELRALKCLFLLILFLFCIHHPLSIPN